LLKIAIGILSNKLGNLQKAKKNLCEVIIDSEENIEDRFFALLEFSQVLMQENLTEQCGEILIYLNSIKNVNAWLFQKARRVFKAHSESQVTRELSPDWFENFKDRMLADKASWYLPLLEA
jgi:hypothetical protein